MMAAGLIALAPQAAHAAAGNKTFETSGGLNQTWNVPADVTSLKVTVKGAAGGRGGLEGGSGGRGASGTVDVAVTPGQAITVHLGKRGIDADPDIYTGAGLGGNSAALGKGGPGGAGSAAVGGFPSQPAAGAGGGGGGATAVLLDGELVATAGAGGGGGGTTGSNASGGNGGGADQNGADGSSSAAQGGGAGDAGSEIGGTGDSATAAGSGGAGGGGGGYQGGGQGAAVASSGGGGGGGGTSHVNAVLAALDGSWTSNVDGDGSVVITYESAFASTVSIDDPNTVVTGEDKDYKVTVTSGSADVPTGSVKLTAQKSGSATVINLGTEDLSSGVATIAHGGLLVGNYTLRATYTPVAGSDSLAATAERTFAVTKGTTSTTIAGPASPPALGDSVDFGVTVANVAPSNGTPTGQVKFFQGGVAIPGGTVNLDASGQAVLTTNKLTVGTSDITAQYSGDAEFDASDDTTSLVGFVVNSGDVTVTLDAEHGTVIAGEKSKLVVDVAQTSGSTVPSGDVQLFVDDQPLGTSQALDANGRTIFYLELPVTSNDGHHHIRAVYAGDSNYDGATSNWIDHFVNIGEAEVSLISDVNPSQRGDAVTFTADVGGLIPTKPYEPTGKVQFYVDGEAHNAPVAIDVNGQATLVLADLPVGTTSVWARYLGDDRYKPATSASLGQVVKKRTPAASTTTIDDPGTVVTGQSKGYKITVAPAVPGPAATGSVTLTAESHNDGTIIAMGTKNLLNGAATIHKDGLRVGDYTLQATYTPDAVSDLLPSIGEFELTVIKGDSSTLIAGPADVPNLGDSVDLGVTVSPVAPAKGVPSGKVRFFQGGVAIPGGLVTLDGSGQAVLTTTKLTVGTADITAQYLGDTEFNASDDTTSLTGFVVNPGDVSVVLEAEHNPVISGEKSKFVVKVVSLTGSATKPTGDVQLFVDDEPLGSEQMLHTPSGSTYFMLELPVTNPNGHHHIRAVYEGDSNYREAVSNWIDQVVNFGDAEVKLTSDVNPSLVGNDVTFSIDVNGLNPTKPYEPTGDVQLYVNGTPFNAPIAIDADGKATVTTDTLPVGTIAVGATYLGDDRYKPASSDALSQVVNKQTATVTLTSSKAEVQYGQPLTLTAKVTSADPDGKATGQVQFYDHGKPVGALVLVDDNGNATVTSTKLAKGVHQFSAKYLGDDKNVEGVSSIVTVTVKENTLTFRLITDKIPAFEGQEALLHAHLRATPGSLGRIAGTVQFYSNGDKVGRPVPVNAQGWASTVVRKLKPGTKRYTGVFIPSASSPFEPTNSSGLIQRVLKGKQNAKVKMSLKRTGDTTARLRFNVRASKGGAAAGRVQVYVNGRPTKSYKLPASGATREVTLTGLTKDHAFVTVSYRPSVSKLRQASWTLKLPKR